MTDAARNELRRSYVSAFHAYVSDANERTLRAAYELGREAVTRELGVLDLAVVHHEALAAELRAAARDDVERITRIAANFLLDSLSAFEMVRRAYVEARETARLERRQAGMLRRLSSLLADASLALDASGSVEEMLQLVAEQARELTGAASCFAMLFETSGVPAVEAVAGEESDEHVAALARPVDVAALRRLVPDRGWLAAPLTALDGRELGWIQLLADRDTEFTEVDEAVLAHVAQMTSASVDRVRLYSR